MKRGLLSFRCDRGAITVMAVFMLLFLVAMLYVVVGIGQTIALREGMQDAADASAYSSAILHARGMNLVAFINLLMAALVALLVALRMAQTFLFMAAAALAAAALLSWGSTAPLAAQLTKQGVDMGERFKRAKDIINPILESLHSTQEAVSVIVPWVATADAMSEAASHHKPAKGAFALPGAVALPVESDEFSVLCGHATETAVGLALMPLGKLGDAVRGPIIEASGEIGESTSKFLCGSGKGTPPTHSQKIDKPLPRHPNESACEEEPTTAACEKVEEDFELALPSTVSGHCKSRCTYDGPYESMARLARAQCAPRPGFRPRDYSYQERKVRATFRYDGFEWFEERAQIMSEHLRTKMPSPCGLDGTFNEEEWNLDSGPRDAREPALLCREPLPELETAPAPDTTVTLEFVEVVRVFSCVVTTTKTHTLASSDEAIGGSGSEARSPHRVEKNLELGDEAFQIRAVAFGPVPGPSTLTENGILLSHRGAGRVQTDASTDLLSSYSRLGHLSVAQAEYYYDHKGHVPPQDYLWDMNWAARLKHFRLPKKDTQEKEQKRLKKRSSAHNSRVAQYGGLPDTSSTEDACHASGGAACSSTRGALSLFDSIVRH